MCNEVLEPLATVWLRLNWELLRSSLDFEVFDYISFRNRNAGKGVASSNRTQNRSYLVMINLGVATQAVS